MKKQIKSTIICLGCIIVGIFFLNIIINYCEYTSEKTAIEIYNTNDLASYTKEDARQWVNYHINNSNATKWYLHQMINAGYAPDSISFWSESDYLNY